MALAHADHPYAAIRREATLDVGFDAFGRAFESLLGVMDLQALGSSGGSTDEARERLRRLVGPSGFALFQKLDHGELLTSLGGGGSVKATTYVFGNALIAVEMTKHVPFVGLYVPLRLYVKEVGETRVVITYDVPSAMVAQFGSDAANRVATSLDAKVEKLVEDAFVLAGRRLPTIQ